MDYDSYVRGLEAKRRVTDRGVEYWMARDLMPLLMYASWDKFEAVVERARTAAQSAGVLADNHFSRTGNMVMIGSGAQREKADWFLSRYACYLIAMNADSSKPEVGYAMTYFAAQTRQQELQQQIAAEQQRLNARLRLIENNRRLHGAAKEAGVVHFPFFHSAGYVGFYGMGLSDVKAHKGLPQSEDLLDRIGHLELAALDFKAALTKERLTQNRINTEHAAIQTHKSVGQEVRTVMIRENGVAPENLPTEPSIKPALQKRQRELKRGKTE